MMDVIALTKVLVWPCLILLLCIIFRRPLSALMTPGTGNTSFEVGPKGLKIQKIAAAVAAVAANTVANAELDQPIDQEELAANLTSGIQASLNQSKTAVKKSILWVDDNPSNNYYLVDAFRELSIEIVISQSTEEAERQLKNSKFDLVISDMSRPPEAEAGINLVHFMKDNHISTPIIIFASYWARKHKGQEARFGVELITNNASEVFSNVTKRLLSGGK